ncbi:MAG: hypothetical protein H7Z43_12230, partial [Clostridia bacterium]|nr:hypothetical protein [Deltaproteobacteria bacterium]
PSFVVGGGVLVTNALGFSPALPIASLAYRHDPWRIDLIWPEPTAVYRIAHRVELGASFRFDYPSYRIRPFQTGNGETADYLRVTNHFLDAVVGARLFSNIWLLGKGGVNFGRIARLLKSGRDQIEDARLNLGAAPFASLMLSVRGPEAAPVTPQELDEGAR